MADITFESPAQQSSPLAHFISHYWRTMAVALAALLLAAAGYAWYAASAQQAKVKAENELGAIIAAQTGPERLTALETYLKKAPASTKDAALLEIARTAQDQQAFDKAAEAWNQLAITGPDGMRELAILGRATALALGGDKAQGVKILADFLPKAPKAYRIVVARQLAGMAEEAQAWNEALAAYQLLNDAATGGIKPYYEAKVAEIKAKMN
jgi:hypothetical protein